MAEQVTPRSQDYAQWYTDVLREAELADYGPVRGTMVIRPYGFALWENLQRTLDGMFKATGHQNAYFPMLIPQSFLEKEKEHVEGFSPELAIVTHGGGKALDEPLVIRPTSETIINHMFQQWIHSYRDLPLLINQWVNVVRWEMRTRPFLRTLEFLWQEGHTAHATPEEAEAETLQMLGIYEDFATNHAAVPVVAGRKTEREKFAGAVRSYTIEALMGDGKALQSATSHFLGQNFSKAFGTQFLTTENELEYPWQTSWGMSTRMLGAIIMAHGDDQGLRLPPRLAPIQAVIVPIWRSEESKADVLGAAAAIRDELVAAGVRVHVDEREERPGWKYNHWEIRGVPLRVELGPRDIEAGQVVVARRDTGAKSTLARVGLVAAVVSLLDDVQDELLAQARRFVADNTHEAGNYDGFKASLDKGGFIRVGWAGTTEDEARIQEETGATVRCIPREQPMDKGTCFYTGKPAEHVVVFAKAY